MTIIPSKNVMLWVSQEAVDKQVQEVEDAIFQISRMQNPRKVSNKILRMLEKVKTLRGLGCITETEANRFAYRVKQAGRRGSNGEA